MSRRRSPEAPVQAHGQQDGQDEERHEQGERQGGRAGRRARLRRLQVVHGDQVVLLAGRLWGLVCLGWQLELFGNRDRWLEYITCLLAEWIVV